MVATIFIISLFVYREIVNYITVQKLLNKLMSRNYQEYVVSTGINEPKKTRDNIVVEPDIEEDLNYIGI